MDAIIVLNNYFWGPTNALKAKKVYKENDNFYYDSEFTNFEKNLIELRPYQMIDFNRVNNSTTLPKQVLYLEMQRNSMFLNEQPISFSYDDLQVLIPKF